VTLHEGTKVCERNIGKLEENQLTDGTEGWIQISAIKELKYFSF
jgi:hypothetical protein